jgi:HlyD family secretion protein
MSSNTSPYLPLALAAVVAVGVAYGIHQLGSGTKVSATADAPAPVRPRWTASTQGRVEPRGGEIRLTALSPGRIENVLVKVNDKVRAGDLLVRIDDSDAVARVVAADAEVGVRKRERDTESGTVTKPVQDRRQAEDRVSDSERAVIAARLELDRLQIANHATPTPAQSQAVEAQRKVLDEAQKRLESDRQALRQSLAVAGLPLPTRLESGLTQSRSDLSLAEAALERTRIRAPHNATVLQVIAHVGETASASPEQPLVVVGDLGALDVRAEVEERDVAKVSVGQPVVLKTDSYPGREFKGRVASIARAMRPPKLAQKGPRRPSDLDTLEVMVDVEPGSPLLPGMRVDVYFAVAPAAGDAPAPGSAAAPAPAGTPKSN